MVLDPNEVEPNPRLQITGGKKRCRERSTLCSRRERREHRPYTHAAAASERDDVGFWREVGPPKIIDTSAVGTSHSRRSGRASKPPKRFKDEPYWARAGLAGRQRRFLKTRKVHNFKFSRFLKV